MSMSPLLGMCVLKMALLKLTHHQPVAERKFINDTNNATQEG